MTHTPPVTLLSETNPELENIWSPNNTINFKKIKTNSRQKVKWVCETYGLEYERTIRDQIRSTRKSPYELGTKVIPGVNDIFSTHPWIKSLWNYELNDIDPTTVNQSNRLNLWWVCPITKASYQRQLHRQLAAGPVSVYMTSSKVLPGYNDLETTYPDIAKLWDYDKNEDSPSEVMPFSHKRRWWKLPNGESLELEIRSICQSQDKYLNLETLGEAYPEVVDLWDFKKNKKTPFEVLKTSQETAWFISKNSTSVQRKINQVVKAIKRSRTQPSRTKYVPNRDFTCLTSDYPEIAALWDHEKNTINIENVSSGQKRFKAWWICPDTGVSYQRSVFDQVKSGPRSPFMTGSLVLPGYNDLATLRPEVISVWSDKNTKVPSEISKYSDYEAILVDELGNTFTRTVESIYLYGVKRKESAKSLGEQELFDSISKISSASTVSGACNILKSKEIDILVQEARLGFEFNGLYWHSDKIKLSPRYHYDKWADALEAGYDLIHVWEDEFHYAKEQTLLRVAQFLSFRECLKEKVLPVTSVRIVTLDDMRCADDLFDGDFSGNQNYLGLFSGDELVALVACCFEGSSLCLEKLHLFNVFSDVDGVFVNFLEQISVPLNVSSVRVDLSNGSFPLGVLLDVGFEVVQELPPSYLYHCSRRRLSKDEVVERGFDCEDLPKIWDAGRTVLELSFS